MRVIIAGILISMCCVVEAQNVIRTKTFYGLPQGFPTYQINQQQFQQILNQQYTLPPYPKRPSCYSCYGNRRTVYNTRCGFNPHYRHSLPFGYGLHLSGGQVTISPRRR